AHGCEEPRAGALETALRPHLDREDPTARRRAEFPGAHFADDEAFNAAFPLCNEEEAPLAPRGAVALIEILPIARLGEARHVLVECDDRAHVLAGRGPD